MRRTSLLCVLAVVLMVVMAFPAYAAVEIFRLAVENPLSEPVPQAPAYVDYTLNSKCDVTVEILPSDSAGTPTGDPAVRTETLLAQGKGKHVYLWPCTDNFGVMATVGYYVARLTATNVGTAPDGTYRWDANIGLFVNFERPVPVSEYGYRDSAEAVLLPRDTISGTDDTINGFYGVGVNHNPASPYYGRIYVSHVTNKHVYMYDVDGTFLGRMNDDTVTWMTSAPWDISVASDGYVYVSDRTNMYVYCFSPDGSSMVSRSPLSTNDRSIYASVEPTSGTTYVYVSSGQIVYQLTVAADHTTWTNRVNTGSLNTGSETIFGMWVSPDQRTMYIGSIGGSWKGVRRYTRTTLTGTWANDATWTNSLSAIAIGDVEMGVDGSYLWACRKESGGIGMYKISTATGAQLATYDVVGWGAALDIDNVGNVLCAFGKANTTWAQKYFGMFAEPVATTKVVTTSPFYVPADPAPVLVPNSEEWTYSNPYDELVPNNSDTADVSFKVIDANGFSDIGAITINLTNIKLTSDPDIIVPIPPENIVLDPSDPNGLTAIVTATVSSANGIPYGSKSLPVTVADGDTPKEGGGAVNVFIAANLMNTLVSHVRTGAIIPGATLRAVGGMPGVPGYPFTFDSPYTSDATSGYVEMPIPQGTYEVTAIRSGYKTLPAQTVDIPIVYDPYGYTYNIGAGVKLGALSIAEARAYQGQTLYASVEGLTVAQPKGIDNKVTFVPGMDVRLDQSFSATENYFRHSWYMSDTGDPENGMLFYLKMTQGQGDATSTFTKQWDDSTARDPRSGNSLWIGKRPANGDTVCVAGFLETRPGYETRLMVDDSFLLNAAATVYKQAYYNLTQFGIVPNTALPTAAVKNISDIYHVGGGPLWRPSWGKFVQINNVKVVKWRPDGNYAPPETTTPADHNQFVVVVDSTGAWGSVTFQSLTSYGLTADVCPVNIGDTYNFKGVAGRRVRYGEGTVRARGAEDITWVSAGSEGGTVSQVRGMSGGPVTVRGIVTAVFPEGFYVEDADRSVGVKCTPAYWWVSEGDEVVVSGNLIVAGIDKHIAISATNLPVVKSSGNAKPELGIRLRDVGGHSIGDYDPGITYARGPLNVGLYVTVQGMVTYRDSTGAAPAFYIWDGTNQQRPGMEPAPVQDDTGNIGIRIAHNGWMPAPLSRGLRQYQDFVTIKGIVTLDDTTVPGTVIPVIRPLAAQVSPASPLGITVETAFDTVTAASGAALNWSESTGGANLLSIPAQPAATGDGNLPDPFAGTFYPWDPQKIFASPDPMVPQDITDGGQAMLYRYEDGNLTQYLYDVWAPEAFGGITQSDGYWLYLMSSPWAMSFSGKYSTIPQWYAVENPADILWIGQPHNYATELEAVQLSDGSAVYSFRDASQHEDGVRKNWVNSVGYWWNNQEGTQYDVGLWDDWASQTAMQPWLGYMFTMYEGQKAWIIP